MKNASRLIRSLAGLFTSGVLLTNCGRWLPAQTSLGVTDSPAAATAHYRSEDLLYVSDEGAYGIFVYTYRPRYTFVRFLRMSPQPAGECVDRNQDVYIADAGSYSLFEYAHGDPRVKYVLTDSAGWPHGCAIDPESGDLALASWSPSGEGLVNLAVYKNARGKPKLYDGVSFNRMDYCAYDNKGNLFVVGTSNQAPFVIAELPKGGGGLEAVTLDQTVYSPGGVQWDGKHLAIADQGHAVIYRFDIRGSSGTKVGETQLAESSNALGFFIDQGRVLNPTYPENGPGSVELYEYPKGGNPIRTLQNFSNPVSIVVSQGAK